MWRNSKCVVFCSSWRPEYIGGGWYAQIRYKTDVGQESVQRLPRNDGSHAFAGLDFHLVLRLQFLHQYGLSSALHFPGGQSGQGWRESFLRVGVLSSVHHWCGEYCWSHRVRVSQRPPQSQPTLALQSRRDYIGLDDVFHLRLRHVPQIDPLFFVLWAIHWWVCSWCFSIQHLDKQFIHLLIDWSIDWSIDWLIDFWLIDWMIEWLIDWFEKRSAPFTGLPLYLFRRVRDTDSGDSGGLIRHWTFNKCLWNRAAFSRDRCVFGTAISR